MQAIVGLVTGIAGVLGMIGSGIAMRFWLITLGLMTILKLTGVIVVPWFAGPLTAGAISTGLWMLFLGLIFMGLSFVITAFGAVLMQDS